MNEWNATYGQFTITNSDSPINKDIEEWPACYTVWNDETGQVEFQSVHRFSCLRYVFDAIRQERGWLMALEQEGEGEGDLGLTLPSTDIMIPGGGNGGYGPN